MYYIIYRALGVVNSNNHILLHAVVHCRLQGKVGRLTLIRCYVTSLREGMMIGCHHATAATKLKDLNSMRFDALVDPHERAWNHCGFSIIIFIILIFVCWTYYNSLSFFIASFFIPWGAAVTREFLMYGVK